MMYAVKGQGTSDYTQFVNPRIGTSKMGLVYPVVTVPFGMVEVSPETNFIPVFHENGTNNKANYDYCAGYQYSDTSILGFAHRNFSDTGHSDLGDLLIIPTCGTLMVHLMGGKKRTTEHLDSLFTKEIAEKYIEKNENITRDGIHGNYLHGNEPSHHIPYLLNWTGRPDKTKKTVQMILNEMYSPEIDGLCYNDDGGQMSAWYVFSALGFYSVTPGSTSNALDSPIAVRTELPLPIHKTLVISTKNQSSANVYVKEVRWNGKVLKTPVIDHNELVQGGTLEFLMNDKPTHY